MKLKYLSIILTTIGITILFFISTLTQPVSISLSQISKYEGKQITTEGIVTNHYSTKYNSQIITIKDDNTSVTVFSEEITDLEYGDKIKVTGEVTKYNDGWEIMVNGKSGIIILQKWENLSIPLWQIAQNPSRYEDLNVNLTGYIDSIYDTYFYLTDEEGKHKIFADYTFSNQEKIYQGRNVNITGFFEFDRENFRYILSLNDINHQIWIASGEN